jgi:hypothetical protein
MSLTAREIDDLKAQAATLTDPATDYLIRDFCERVRKAATLTEEAEYDAWRLNALGVRRFDVARRVRELLDTAWRDAIKLVEDAARGSYAADYKRLTGTRPPERVERLTRAVADVTDGTLKNVSGSLGMISRTGAVMPLRRAYLDACDWAHHVVATGAATYTDAIQQATRNCVKHGIQYVDYQSGRHEAVESVVRRATLTALGKTQAATERIVHDDVGANGWEISAHACSAPDHEPIQGRQYTDAEFEALNSSLMRPIGTLNCAHIAMPVIIGVSTPQYTDEELEKMRADNEKGITYEGKHYTGYDATQRQRALERRSRAVEKATRAAHAAGDTKGEARLKTKREQIQNEYKKFSRAAKLRQQPDRMWVP